MELHTGTPFWPVRDGLPNLFPPLRENLDCDVAVMGAGITGALVLQALVAAGISCVALDAREAVSGSTAASTALLQYEVDVPLRKLVACRGEKDAVRAYRLCREGLERLRRLDRLVGGKNGFRSVESLQGASRPSHLSALREEAALRRKHGFDVRLWSRRMLRRVSTLPYEAALLSGDAAVVDPYRFAHALLRWSESRGARVFDRTRVLVRRRRRTGYTLSTSRGYSVRCRSLVLATGYDAASSLPPGFTRLTDTFALVTEPLDAFPGWPGERLLWETARPYLYMRKTDDGRLLVGGYDEPSGGDPARRARMLERKSAHLLRRLGQLFPKCETELGYAWSGAFAETPDGLPYIGRHPGEKDLYLALGYGGNGITFSAIAAEILRAALLGEANPDAALFRFEGRARC